MATSLEDVPQNDNDAQAAAPAAETKLVDSSCHGDETAQAAKVDVDPTMIGPFDPLVAFFGWWMHEAKGGLFPSVHDGVTKIGCDYTGLVLYRQPPFQVELWIIAPNAIIPEHAHPAVDSFLVHVTGDLTVYVGEQRVLDPALTAPGQDGVSKGNGRWVRIGPGQHHKGSAGASGAAFMNIQLWLDGKPRSTDSDWQGDPLNEEHKKKLKDQKLASYVKSLRENSGAATKEAGNTSLREQPLADPGEPLPGDLTQSPSTDGGQKLSSAEEAEFGRPSTVNA